jgi:hypothetical protein
MVDLAVYIRGGYGHDLVGPPSWSFPLCKRSDVRFTTTVHGAYVIIGITGFSWGLAQCKSALAYP